MQRFSRFHPVRLGLAILLLSVQGVSFGQTKQGVSKGTQAGPAVVPCPPIRVGAAVPLGTGVVKKGEVVAPGNLDAMPKWLSCAMPPYSTEKRVVARIALEIDEDGKVVKVKPRGTQEHPKFYDSVAEAARSWRVSRPRARGVPVKTELQLDLTYR